MPVLMMLAAVLAVAGPGEPRGPVKVFVLAGQSNMEGQGMIRGEKPGTLESLLKDPASAPRFKHLVDAQGKWVVREDVWIWYLGRTGGLTVGYTPKEDSIGPELQFGHVVGDAFDTPVLLIKTAWGGKSLAKDFRPPSAGGEVGPSYTAMLGHVKEVLANLKTLFPRYDGQGYEIAGFGWHQGWNDRINQAYNDEYEKNLAHLIRDVRKDLGVPKLPFVIAETGMTGPEEKHPRALSLMKAQAAVAEYPEFKGNVAFVGTKDFWRPAEASPANQGFHWNRNAETYFLIGDAMGKAMLKLMESR
jgi:alpha-galactosidase